METRIVQVDAFTAAPFAGNPAGVCVLPDLPDEGWMQAVAAEMNLSETAFLWPRGEADYDVRYFTPACEVDLCGHATLASAHALWEDGAVAQDRAIDLYAPGGDLVARQEDGGWIRLDFPALTVTSVDVPSGVAVALGAEPVSTSRSEAGYLLVEMDSEQTVRGLQPNCDALMRCDCGTVMVTAASSSAEHDFVSRFFGPAVGIDEDPVTGVMHCHLAPYWAAKLGKQAMSGHQVSRRGGVVRVEHHGERVHLLGQAVTVLLGALVGNAARGQEKSRKPGV